MSTRAPRTPGRPTPPKPATGLVQSQLQAIRAVLAAYKAPTGALPAAAPTLARAPRVTPDDVTLESVTIAANSAGSKTRPTRADP